MVDSFRKNQEGAVALMFAIALVPILVFMGVALDYTRAADARTKMQAAIDATALQVAHESATVTDANFTKQARATFDGDFSATDAVQIDSFTASRDGSVITVSASGHLKTSLLGVVDVSKVNFGATTTAQSGSKNLEVVMALDNTGSMNDNGKIGALRDAATELVDTLSQNVTEAGQLKIGLVPFATGVRVDPSDSTYSQANWIDFSATDKQVQTCTSGRYGRQTCTTSTQRTWSGCIRDRSNPNNTSDAAVTGTSTKYPAISSCNADEGNLAFVQPMTEDFSDLKTQIGNMTAGGNTNVTIGAIWGLALLSQQAPFTDGVAYGDPKTDKFLIVLTDGANTGDRYSTCNSYGLNTSCVKTMNNRTLAACTAAKNAGVIVYTIGVMLDPSTTEGSLANPMLQSCATDASHYLPVSDASQLVPTFLGIADSIQQLRLTN